MPVKTKRIDPNQNPLTESEKRAVHDIFEKVKSVAINFNAELDFIETELQSELNKIGLDYVEDSLKVVLSCISRTVGNTEYRTHPRTESISAIVVRIPGSFFETKD